jgi:hypothetical protein
LDGVTIRVPLLSFMTYWCAHPHKPSNPTPRTNPSLFIMIFGSKRLCIRPLLTLISTRLPRRNAAGSAPQLTTVGQSLGFSPHSANRGRPNLSLKQNRLTLGLKETYEDGSSDADIEPGFQALSIPASPASGQSRAPGVRRPEGRGWPAGRNPRDTRVPALLRTTFLAACQNLGGRVCYLFLISC